MNETERDLVAVGAAAIPAPGAEVFAPPTDAPRPRRTTARATISLYDKILESIADLAALGFAIVLWWIGAQFTLAFFLALGVPLDRLGTVKWLIPAFITAIEVKFWPRKTLKQHLIALFVMVAGIDLLTSVIGGKAWLAGRSLAGAFTLPATGPTPWMLSLIAALLCTFWPEKLARTAVAELRRIWF